MELIAPYSKVGQQLNYKGKTLVVRGHTMIRPGVYIVRASGGPGWEECDGIRPWHMRCKWAAGKEIARREFKIEQVPAPEKAAYEAMQQRLVANWAEAEIESYKRSQLAFPACVYGGRLDFFGRLGPVMDGIQVVTLRLVCEGCR